MLQELIDILHLFKDAKCPKKNTFSLHANLQIFVKDFFDNFFVSRNILRNYNNLFRLIYKLAFNKVSV